MILRTEIQFKFFTFNIVKCIPGIKTVIFISDYTTTIYLKKNTPESHIFHLAFLGAYGLKKGLHPLALSMVVWNRLRNNLFWNALLLI